MAGRQNPKFKIPRADGNFLAARRGTQKGFTLVEVLIAVGVFLLVAVGIYGAYTLMVRFGAASRSQVVGLQLAQERLELVRNLAYADVGTVGGVPSGVINPVETVTRDNTTYTLTATIRNIDDPFDGDFAGTIPGKPRDTAPADYKRVEIEIGCAACPKNPPLVLTTNVVPRGLEGASDNGALFILVFDANGLPVPQATVTVTNPNVSPAVDLTDLTDNSGKLNIIDIPPAVEQYRITVAKAGYSSDRTFPPNDPENPNPVKRDATVASQTITEISFAIDRVSAVELATADDRCRAIGGEGVHVQGAKLIGQTPDVFKTSFDTSTDASGRRTLSNLEWDSYSFGLTSDVRYDIAGTIPILPVNLAPNSSQNVTLVLAAHTSRNLRVLVRDSVTSLPLSGTTVELERGSATTTRETGAGYFSQTDWSGGAGQEVFVEEDRYASDDGNVDVTSGGHGPGGSIRLREFGGEYAPRGALISSTFDFGGPTNFTNLTWSPGSQPPQTGVGSAAFQIATNNDSATWNFLGPDGTASTTYQVINTAINPVHNGDRYFRYRAILSTASATTTPEITDVAVSFTTSCSPPGQAFFEDLQNGPYDITMTRSGYQPFAGTVDVSGATIFEVTLNP